jgi:predicted oxidoreductase
MDYRRLGKSGLKVSEFSFGAWVTFAKQVGEDDAASLMGYAYDHGVNFFDNAEGYEHGNAELVMGEALAQLKWSRDSYAVSSKVFWGGEKPTQKGLSAKHVTDAAHAALNACASTISISTSATGPISTRRSKRPCGRCTISSRRARCCTGARPNGQRSRSRKPIWWRVAST